MIRATTPTLTANLPCWRPGWVDKKTHKPVRGFWYCWHSGKQVNLSKFGAPRQYQNKGDKSLALEARARWLEGLQQVAQAEAIRAAQPVTVYEVCQFFVVHHLPKTCPMYQKNARRYLETFCAGEPGRLWKPGQKLHANYKEHGGRRYSILPYAGWGNMKIAELTEHHAEAWVKFHPNWGDTGQRNALKALKAAMEYATKHRTEDGRKLLSENPLSCVTVPGNHAREEVLTVEQYDQLRAKSKPRFRDFLSALWDLGCRPGELAKVRASHYDPKSQRWVLPPKFWKNGKKTGRSRYISLGIKWTKWTEARISEMDGEDKYLFRTSWRTRCSSSWWDKNLVHARDAAGLSPEVCAYTLRHSFITRAIDLGMTVADIATQTGTSFKMIDAIYSKHHESVVAGHRVVNALAD
jgi:integrase